MLDEDRLPLDVTNLLFKIQFPCFYSLTPQFTAHFWLSNTLRSQSQCISDLNYELNLMNDETNKASKQSKLTPAIVFSCYLVQAEGNKCNFNHECLSENQALLCPQLFMSVL